MIDLKRAKEHLKIQGKLDKFLQAEKYPIQPELIRLAYLEEVGELLKSDKSWVWWKKGDIDLENAKVEIVDIYHFILSYLTSPFTHIAEYNLKMLENYEYNSDVTKEEKLNILTLALFNESPVIQKVLLNLFYNFAFEYFENFEELDKLYLAKVYLNISRNKKGYKEGKYEKGSLEEGTEDNQIVLPTLLKLDREELVQKIKKYLTF